MRKPMGTHGFEGPDGTINEGQLSKDKPSWIQDEIGLDVDAGGKKLMR